MHYYTFNIGDYRKDTGHLTTLEHGIYRQLLDWYYLDERPIPKETQTVIRRLRLASGEEANALQNVLDDFFFVQDDGYHQVHCDAEIERYQGKKETNKVNGKLGGRPKKTQSVILENPDESDLKGNQQPTTNNQQPITKKEREKTGASAEIVFPVDLDEHAWQKWIGYRKAAGKALKPVSWPSAMHALANHGPHQMAVVEQSIANGWQGLFALKPRAVAAAHADGTPLNKQEALEASNRAVVARLLAKEAQHAGQ